MSYGGSDKYYNPANKVVNNGETANASDLNNINTAVDTAFEQVSDDLETINIASGDWATLAEKWATDAQGTNPDPTQASKYSAEANAEEAEGWASAAGDHTLADGTTSTELSAKAQATLCAAEVALCEAETALCVAAKTAAETAQGLAETAETNAAASAVDAAADAADAAAQVLLCQAEVALCEAETALCVAAKTDAETAETNAAASETKAAQWADEAEDVPVETLPDRFSAYHWSEKAAAIVAGNHTIASHVDTSATGAQLDLLVGAGDASALHNHDGRYYTETESDAAFAPIVHTHDDRYYTETEADNLLSSKSDTTHTHDDRYYTETEADAAFAPIVHVHDDRYYTETECDNLFAAAVHTHDDRYYTETEIDSGIYAIEALISKPNLLINPEFNANTRGYISGAVIATDSYFYDMWKSDGSSATAAVSGKQITLSGAIEQRVDEFSEEAVDVVTVSADVISGSLDVTLTNAISPFTSYTVTLTASNTSETITATDNFAITVGLEKNGATTLTFRDLKLESGSRASEFETTTKQEEFLKGAPYLVDQGYAEENNPIVVKSGDTSTVELMSHVDVGLTTTSSMATSASTNIGFNTEVEDVLGEFTTGASARFTATYDGYYLVNLSTLLKSTVWAANEHCVIELFKNGTALIKGSRVVQGAATASIAVSLDFSRTVKLDATDYIELKVYHNQGASIDLQDDALHTQMTIDRIL